MRAHRRRRHRKQPHRRTTRRIQHPRHLRRRIVHRHRVRHRHHCRKPARRSSARPRRNRLLVRLPRLPQMHVDIDQSRRHHASRGINLFRHLRSCKRTRRIHRIHPSVAHQHITRSHPSRSPDRSISRRESTCYSSGYILQSQKHTLLHVCLKCPHQQRSAHREPMRHLLLNRRLAANPPPRPESPARESSARDASPPHPAHTAPAAPRSTDTSSIYSARSSSSPASRSR